MVGFFYYLILWVIADNYSVGFWIRKIACLLLILNFHSGSFYLAHPNWIEENYCRYY
jgi:hypothetical protein